MTRSEMTIKTMTDAVAFLDQMETTEENRRYFNSVYAMLVKAKTGDRIEIDKIVKSENMRKFIGCVCMYIWDTNKAEFDNEYKFIKKL